MSHKIFDDTWILYQISLVNLKTFLLIRLTFANFYRKTLPPSQTEKKDSYYNLLYKRYGSRNIEHLCTNGFIDGVRWLQENPLGLTELIEYNIVSEDNLALWPAARYGHLELVKYIINLSKIDPRFYRYTLVICSAVQYGHLDVVKFLLTPHNAPALKNIDPADDSNNALYFAIKYGHLDIITFLLTIPRVYNQINSRRDYISGAAKNGHLHIIKFLVEYFINNDLYTCLYGHNISHAIGIASEYGYLEIVKYLSNIYGADASCNDNMAVRYAAQNGHLEIVKFLTNTRNAPALKDVDASAKCNYAICAAAMNGHTDIVEYLSTLPRVFLPMYYERLFKLEGYF